MTKLSVIIPVYNKEQYIVRCVESVVKQSIKDFEVILVDDGSTDNSGILCDDLEKKYSNISVFHKKNGGVSGARNLGMRYAKGEYIAFVDADDFIEENMYEVMLSKLDRDQELQMCVCLWNFISLENKNVIKQSKDICPDYGKQNSRKFFEHIYDDPYMNGVVVSVCNKVFKKKFIEKFTSEGRYAEDDLLMTKVLTSKDVKILVVDQWLYNYCENETQMTKNNNNLDKCNFLDGLLERVLYVSYNDELEQKTLKLYEEMCIEYYFDFYKKFDFDKYLKQFKKIYMQLMFNGCVSVKTKIRWLIFITNPRFYKKYILKLE